ncbi:Uridine phosphorylase [Babesia sp. Xinjiang]|uniref:Uridine phosphorylase n=1 Tax=Babesia sp. Xinjiang TaxID=462227 RepID=UPI000A250DDF|nr:Uridine phosphorylase [Babesia sp. Xinjiang]ORM41885.1 Uridine phosphorylase [Babesia sp. Xinjiang]
MTETGTKIFNRTCIPKDRVHRVAIICGDQNRFDMFKKDATNYREFGSYLCWKAAEFEYNGDYFLLACHGVGSHPTAVLVRELIELGVKCIIRSGTSGTYVPTERKIGDICICYGCVRGDSVSLHEIDAAFPAVAHPDVVEALRKASEGLKLPTHLGVCNTTDLFYRTGMHGGDPRETLIKCAVAIEDTDNSALLTLCNIYGIRGGAICTIDGCPFEWHQGNYGPKTTEMTRGKECMVRITMQAASELVQKIKEEETQGITGI